MRLTPEERGLLRRFEQACRNDGRKGHGRMNFKSDEHLECELDARICAGVVEDLSRTLNEATRIIKILVASAHRNERDYMPAEWHDALDDAKLFLAGMPLSGGIHMSAKEYAP